MNWGTKITISFILFAAFIVSMVAYMSMQQVDLVSHDYYEKESNYQKHIQKMENASVDRMSIEYQIKNDSIYIQLVGNNIGAVSKGTISFFRPSDLKLDKTFDISLNELQTQVFPLSKFKEGVYNLQVDWQSNGKSYWVEKQVYL
jgi:hypothetical protein